MKAGAGSTGRYLFDRAARHVRVGETRDAARASDALTLPLGAPAARDALTTLYYVRTLPLSPGSTISIPVNEAGSALVLQVGAGAPETIDYQGRPTPAVRLDPRLMRRIERRRPIVMTIWLSADDRRVPLRAIVEAGFGKVTMELVEYSR